MGNRRGRTPSRAAARRPSAAAAEPLEPRRLLAAADLDPTFGAGGIVRRDVSGSNDADSGAAVAVQADGKIVVGGGATLSDPSGPDSAFALSRYNPDGSPDTTFGDGGVVRTRFTSPGTRDAGIASVAIQPDGKIVVGGTTRVARPLEPDNNNFALARYNPDGSPDATFGDGGTVEFDFGGPASYDRRSNDQLAGLAVRPDGRIVVAGTVNDYSFWYDVGLAQFNPDGSLDTTFGDQGRLRHVVGYAVHVGAMELLPDGRLLVAGSTRTGTASVYPVSVLLARYTAQGRPDPAFGVGGVVGQSDLVGATVDSIENARGEDLAIDPGDGSIYVVAHVFVPPGGVFEPPVTNWVIKYTADGRRATDFGNDGRTFIVERGDGTEDRRSIETDPRGGVAVAITTGTHAGAGEPTWRWAFARVTPAGALDLSFSPAGVHLRTPPGDRAWIADMTMLAGGAMLVVGGDLRDTVIGKVTGGADPVPDAGAIAGALFHDANRNGLRDGGERPLEGQWVYVDEDDDGAYDAGEPFAVSDAEGRYALLNLPAGTHVVRTRPGGTWKQTTPKNNGAYRWRLDDGAGLGGADFGLIQLPKITLYSYRDDNVNGAYDAGEPPLAGRLIYQDWNGNGMHDAGEPGQATAEDGTAVFEVTPGAHAFRQAPVRDTYFISPPTGSLVATIAGEDAGSFGGPWGFGSVSRFAVAHVSGIVFSDANGDGVKQSGESAVNGLTVYLDDDNDGALDPNERTALSEFSSGRYEFRNLLPGTYTVRVRLPHAAIQTLPAGNQGHVLTLSGGDTATGRDFGYRFPPQRVVGRHVFYNNSALDGRDRAGNAADDAAIATDKQALLPGQSPTPPNFTTYTGGINGVMIDLAYVPESFRDNPSAFGVWVASTATPATWRPAPRPSVSHRLGAGVGGTDRVTLTWPDGTIRNTWLRVVVGAGTALGLAQSDAFVFGNLVGDTGDDATAFRVNALDLAGVKRALGTASTLTGRFDFDRDGRVNALDLAAVRQNLNQALTTSLGTPPAPAAVPHSVSQNQANLSTSGTRQVLDEPVGEVPG